ncbi:uncharacterized protein LOC113324214 [Papaver somniferum]|uniref:uncharacterized protein LOC113324214 n=1 Tax=Papaver somniferum TaxID=3469 RepID=UPI000E700A03|nr:uncharacterized protein LOC113324214 [Papaver somniferum]
MLASDNNPQDEHALHELVMTQNELNLREVQHSIMMKQKSRIQWVKEGSANTNFFHTNIKVRQTRNMICELEDNEGNLVVDQEKIADILVEFFQKRFQYQEVNINELLLDVIPQLITEEDQNMLDSVPSSDEIKKAVWEMNADGAPGPDSYSGIFYNSCWEIINKDFVEAIQYFWRRKYIPRGLNSIFLVLLPKTQNAKKPNQFRPIGLSNFSFKVFTKILSTRMSGLMSKLVSSQQAAYIKGRNIHEQVMLASELVNEMRHKRRGGNVGMELDISQAYDSVNWSFLFQVLKKYGFSESWCACLHVLFSSAKVSVMVNGGPKGFFSMERGLKQGDPLSPILFVLMEEVLSIGLTKLVESRELQPMMEITSFPDKYLGVILKPGRVKSNTVWPMMEMMESYLEAWKGRLLSFHDRLVLIKSVLCSIPIYNMAVYKWPSSIIKICERIIRNVLWTGDSEERKYDTLKWSKVCNPYNEGGLGIRRLMVTNKALLMKMMWKLLNSEEDWEKKFTNIPSNPQGIIPIPLPSVSGGKDMVVWCGDVKGVFTTAAGVEKIRVKEPKLHWPYQI